MRKISTRKTVKTLSFLLLALFILCIPASCVPEDSAALIESLLKNTEGGEMTFVTSEGETVKVTITKVGQAADVTTTPAKTVKPVVTTAVKPTGSPKLADYLPCVNSIECIFKTLGVWEQASELQKQGKSWSQVAAELGYDKDSMFAGILELNQEKLQQAKELGLIDQSTYEYKIQYYGELALKYIVKIFTASTPTTSDKLSDYLPVLNSIEDAFKTLGVWEQAAEKYNSGLRWSQVAKDLGYDKDSMYARILELNDEKLTQAKELGLIDQSTYEYKIKLYGDQGLKYIGKIFES